MHWLSCPRQEPRQRGAWCCPGAAGGGRPHGGASLHPLALEAPPVDFAASVSGPDLRSPRRRLLAGGGSGERAGLELGHGPLRSCGEAAPRDGGVDGAAAEVEEEEEWPEDDADEDDELEEEEEHAPFLAAFAPDGTGRR
mmetsp:Transcript_61484/g.183245  ORF Transcript_61484/g.183245 Transcript_61484/m.183245 type:complete len:140 (-) Transcript_61484:791-1210(-)